MSLLLVSCTKASGPKPAAPAASASASASASDSKLLPATGNTRVESFANAKRILLKRVFYDHRTTLYCDAPFHEDKQVDLPAGFQTPSSQSRMNRIEWEHIVPAENFGRTFTEWREGAPECTGPQGPFKGRKCADLASREYRLMQADFYNLYPAIGAVNAIRKNYAYDELSAGTPASFGTCPMKIRSGKAEPPDFAKGLVARTHLYMQAAYPRFHLSRQQQRLMEAWDRKFPADDWECLRAERIKALQGNENPYTVRSCARRNAARK